jgi:hypothetical protein
MTPVKPSIGRIVHYVSYGTPGGEYTSECRAAIVTEVADVPTGPNGEYKVGLFVANPTGVFLNRDIEQDEIEIRAGGDPADPGRPYQGGTWHWPERV